MEVVVCACPPIYLRRERIIQYTADGKKKNIYINELSRYKIRNYKTVSGRIDILSTTRFGGFPVVFFPVVFVTTTTTTLFEYLLSARPRANGVPFITGSVIIIDRTP